jgi:hypothetical protein
MVKLRNQKANPLFTVLFILESPFPLRTVSVEAYIPTFSNHKSLIYSTNSQFAILFRRHPGPDSRGSMPVPDQQRRNNPYADQER